MGKPKKTAANGESSNWRMSSNKILTQDGKIKKKVLKQFTNYKCEYCDKRFFDNSGLRTHEQIHFNLEFPCESCSYVAKTKKYLARHMKQKHAVRRHECGMCGKAFAMPNMLREHIMVHTGEKPHECDVCGKRFRVTYTLNCHKLTHTNEKPFKCSFCAYACRDSSTLRRHEHRHMGYVRTFDCKICPRKFESKSKLKYHLSSVHLNYLGLDLKKHKCEHCSKTFHLRSQLRAHVEYTHDPSQACPCPVCGRTLKHKRYLAIHLRSHFDERPHACRYPKCGKRFKAKGDLKKHSIIHMQQLHKSCSKCDMRFSRPERLLKHMKQHEPREKSVYCDYCGVSFFTKNYLIKHITQKHCKEKQKFTCDYCGLTTFNKPAIVMHIKYGQCRDEDLYCKICKYSDKYKNKNTLRSHYLLTHKMRYRPRKEKKKKKKKKTKEPKEKKPSVEVKVEPVDADPYEQLQLSPLDIKQESDIEKEEPDLENDLISYSNAVLSEDLQEFLLKNEGETPEAGSFDAFLLQHVFHNTVKREVEDKIETDKQTEAVVSLKIKDLIQKAEEEEARRKLEKKKMKEAKLLEKKLKKEAKLLRAKKRREKYELERVRLMYNERMRRAVEEATNKSKEPAKKITYFKKKPAEDSNHEIEAENKNGNSHKEVSNITNDEPNDHNMEENDKIGTLKSINNDCGIIEKSVYESNNSITNPSEEIINSSNYDDNDSEIKTTTNQTTDDKPNFASNNKKICLGSESINVITTTNEFSGNVSPISTRINDGLELTNDQIVETNDSQTVHNENKNDQHITEDNADVNCSINCTKQKDSESSNITDNAKEEAVELGSKNQENSEISQENNMNFDENSNNAEGHTTNYVLRKRGLNKTKDSNGENSDDNKSDSGSDFDPDSGDESVPKKKINFKTFQCYICFKLFPTKDDQLSHCATHFDTCSTTQLSKCPVCGHVTNKSLVAHVKKQHGVNLLLPNSKMVTREDKDGSKYCYQINDSVVEIIPSVKKLNHQAAIDIDKKKRHMTDMTVAKTKLVKKGKEWILEKVNVDASAYQELPEFTDEELSGLPVSSTYTERLGQLGRLARSKGVRILYPCHLCDKICQNFAALRLHDRRHDPDKKPFAPKKYKRDCGSPPPKEKPKVNLEHRFSKPQPIKNKHKCDEKLMEFYETHIRGDDIEFWQFLKIYNKMDRENVNEFKDLENRIDFGIHTTAKIEEDIHIEEENNADNAKNNTKNDEHIPSVSNRKDNSNVKNNSKAYSSKTAQHKLSVTNKLGVKVSGQFKKVTSKLAQKGQMKENKRVILLSRKERMERERIKAMMREKIRDNVK